jgi:type IV pilus assembly protein PilQ
MAKKIIDKFDVKQKNTTIAVNHTTPAEMANLICNVLLQGAESGGGGSSSSDSEITIGENVIACTYGKKVDAGDLASFDNSNLMVSYFPQRGTINVQGGAENQIQMIKEFIVENDKKQPQAYLELSIIELNESGTRQFDNTWEIWSKNFSASFTEAVKSNPKHPMFFRNDVSPVDDTIKKFTGTPTLIYSINYLMKNGKGRVVANPRIIVTNGETSTIDLTSDYIKSVKSQVIQGSITGATQKTYEIADDDGIKIEMTPFISPDGYVTMNITPDYATVKEKVQTPNEEDPTIKDTVATLLQRRNLELKNVRIKDGETLVIGGMIKENEEKTISKIPFLGDLPGIGFFFRNTSTTKRKEELVLMITPRIIKDTEDIDHGTDIAL